MICLPEENKPISFRAASLFKYLDTHTALIFANACKRNRGIYFFVVLKLLTEKIRNN